MMFKQYYQSIMRMEATISSSIVIYETYEKEGEINKALLITTVIEFWIVTVSIFGALYEVKFKNVFAK